MGIDRSTNGNSHILAAMEAGKAAEGSRNRKLLRWGIVGLAVLVGLIAWIASRGGDDGDSTPAASASAEPRIVSQEELEEIAANTDYAIFWAGPMDGKELEVSKDESGNVLVRYLSEGAEPGSENKEAIAIGSYPLQDPTTAVEGFAEREGAIVTEAEDGRELVSSSRAPSSVYFASPDGGVQVEVYAKSPQRAESLAASGKVEPVG